MSFRTIWQAHGAFDSRQSVGLIALYLLLLPALLTGAIRSSTGASIEISLALSLVLTGSLTSIVVPRVWVTLRLQWKATLPNQLWLAFRQLAPFAVSAVVVAKLWNRDFSGFMNIDGWDGGSHLFLKQIFVESDANIYNGFVGQYALSYVLERWMGFDPFHAVAAGFYAAIAISVALPTALLIFVVDEDGSPDLASKLFGVGTGLAALLWLAHSSFLPFFHYLQGMGFYPQVFGMVPISMLWLLDAVCIRASTRLAAATFCLFLSRYTYGLNLPDFVAATGLISLWSVRRDSKALAPVIAATGCLALAAVGYTKLVPIFEIWGGIARNNGLMSLATNIGQGLMVASTALLLSSLAADGSFGHSLIKVVRFPLAVLATNSASFCFFAGTAKQPYYLQKYQAMALWLVASAVAIATGYAASLVWSCIVRAWQRHETLVVTTRFVTIAVFVTSSLTLGAHTWRLAFAAYRPSYLERIEKDEPPYAYLRPLVDRRATRLIAASLSQKHKRFGGYITGNFPTFSFMNGYFGYHTGIQDFFPPNTGPGFCVFWVAAADDSFPNGNQAVINSWRNMLAKGPGASCTRYPVAWKQATNSLCERCY